MKPQLTQLFTAINARTLRERLLILGAGIALIIMAADTLFADSARKTIQANERKSQQLQTDIQQLETELLVLQHTGLPDPNIEKRNRIETLEQEKTRLMAQLEGAIEQFVTPPQMNRLLHTLVTSTHGLTLQSIRSLPAAALTSTTAAQAQGDAATELALPVVWQRSAELEFSGDYNALLAYLRTLETLQWRINWDSLTIYNNDNNAQNAPTPRFVLRTHTLSLSEDWIGAD